MHQKRALILHGTMGSPEGNWFPWLKKSLESSGWSVSAPNLPTPDNQNLESWITALKKQVSDLDDLDLVIGHSLGATFILRLLEQSFCKAEKIILVSPVYDVIDIPDYDALNTSFLGDFDWATISENYKSAHILREGE